MDGGARFIVYVEGRCGWMTPTMRSFASAWGGYFCEEYSFSCGVGVRFTYCRMCSVPRCPCKSIS
jgi:hypothetical protein